MKEFIEKISTYHILNYLLPGVVFYLLADKFLGYSIGNGNIFTEIFIYYFIGLTISRFGSIIIEPLLKKLSVIKFASYSKFLSATKKDSKLEILSEENNMHRSLTATFALLLLLRVWVAIENKVPGLKEYQLIILIVLLFLLFTISYRKQTSYLTSRIEYFGKAQPKKGKS